VAVDAVGVVEPLRVEALEALHPARQRVVRRLDDEMVVVAHLAPGIEVPAEAPGDIAEPPQVPLAIVVALVGGLPPVAAREDVIEPTGDRLTWLPRHQRTVAAANDHPASRHRIVTPTRPSRT
jgi:hypothetical protein